MTTNPPRRTPDLPRGAGRVTIVDRDRELAEYLAAALSADGFVVEHKTIDPNEPFDPGAPDLLIVDPSSPDTRPAEGLAALLDPGVLRRTPTIVISAYALVEDRVASLSLGADDFVPKPLSAEEVVVRVHAVLRRASQMREMSPLTGLPGNAAIQRELVRRVSIGDRIAVVHADLDHFKAFNDRYGFLRGDAVIAFCARTLQSAGDAAGAADMFLGHIGGDDFVAILDASPMDDVCKTAITLWDAGIGEFYDEDDRERGWIEAKSRTGEPHRVGLVSLSLGVASNPLRGFSSPWEASALAAEMKEHAKRFEGSNYQVDRRT